MRRIARGMLPRHCDDAPLDLQLEGRTRLELDAQGDVDLGQLLRHGRQHLLVHVLVLGLRDRRGRRRLARALAGRARPLPPAAAPPRFSSLNLKMEPHHSTRRESRTWY